jgi:hypothetical protein
MSFATSFLKNITGSSGRFQISPDANRVRTMKFIVVRDDTYDEIVLCGTADTWLVACGRIAYCTKPLHCRTLCVGQCGPVASSDALVDGIVSLVTGCAKLSRLKLPNQCPIPSLKSLCQTMPVRLRIPKRVPISPLPTNSLTLWFQSSLQNHFQCPQEWHSRKDRDLEEHPETPCFRP